MNNQYEKPYLSITDTAERTGLSRCYLKKLKDIGQLPHIMVGNRTYINVPKLLEQLEAENERQERV